MKKDFENIQGLYAALKINRERNLPLWNSISKITGINVDPNGSLPGKTTQGEQKDECVDDPTSAISVNQAGDYMWGIIWGNGDGVLSLVPSDDVLEEATEAELTQYYNWRTKKLLGHMNHSEAGLATAGKSYCYDQFSFGTSGIGVFPNQAYKSGIEESLLVFREYGIDNLVIDEGNNGLIDIIFVPYKWRVNRIVGQFAKEKGVVNAKLLRNLPQSIQDAYNNKDFNQEFNIVHGIIPREDYDPKLQGKRGAKYRGIWFLDESADAPFYEEDYRRIPIGVCRAIKFRGEVYGRSCGTILLATIRSVNYMVGKVIEIVEKQAAPALGIWGNAIVGDGVLDSSSEGVTVFNREFASAGDPVFKLHDIGDPANIIKFLIPYLNEKITTAFKIDVLLDFNDKSNKTATEMLQRAIIRDRSLSGMLQQQKNEMLEPAVHRSISIEDEVDDGVDKGLFKEISDVLIGRGKGERIIPTAVLNCRKRGKCWYKIRWNNALDKLTRAEKLEALMQMLNVVTALAALNPAILEAIDWYKLLMDFKNALNLQGEFFCTADEFKAKIAAAAERQAQILALQSAKIGSEAQRNISGAKKDEATVNTERGQ